MELRKESIGKMYISALLGTTITVTEENIKILLADKQYQFFKTDIESTPLLPESTEVKSIPVEISERNDKRLILDKLSAQALKGFPGRSAKDIKKEMTLIGIEFPKNCSTVTLADIIINLPHDFSIK